MKKLAKLASIFAIGSSLGGLSAQVGAVGNPEFVFNEDGLGGVLRIEAVDIDGVKAFENLELELDFTNSQFTLKNYSEADNTIPEEPIETIEQEGLRVGLRGCLAESRVVTCHLLLTSVEFDREISLCGSHCWGTGSAIFDNLGNQYDPTGVTLANAEDDRYIIQQKIVADITTRATIRFENFSTRATNISLLNIHLVVGSNVSSTGNVGFEFRNISF